MVSKASDNDQSDWFSILNPASWRLSARVIIFRGFISTFLLIIQGVKRPVHSSPALYVGWIYISGP
jgi:hypothetical protein